MQYITSLKANNIYQLKRKEKLHFIFHSHVLIFKNLMITLIMCQSKRRKENENIRINCFYNTRFSMFFIKKRLFIGC